MKTKEAKEVEEVKEAKEAREAKEANEAKCASHTALAEKPGEGVGGVLGDSDDYQSIKGSTSYQGQARRL